MSFQHYLTMAASPQTQLFKTSAAVQTRFHRPELDALRFGAFSLVFLHHALPHDSASYAKLPHVAAQLLAAIGRAGALGVDLFFALSAYLITELLLREHRSTGTLDIRAFYVRRILRIWPLYFFALLILAPLMRFVEPADVMPATYTAAFGLLAGNWACALMGYPASSFALLWSVSIEEQFYLAWPLLLRANPSRIRGLALLMVAIASAMRVTLATGGVVHPGVWCNTFARLDPIAGGALLASISTPGSNAGQRASAFVVGLLGLLAAGGFGTHDGWGSIITYPCAAASAVAVLYGTLGMNWNNAVFGYLGKISFGLYVFHVAALRIIPTTVVALALTVTTAAISYRFLETPFLRLKDRFARV